MSLPSTTITHIPRGVRPLWVQILSTELRHAHSSSIWGAIRVMMLAKCVLRLPPKGGGIPSLFCYHIPLSQPHPIIDKYLLLILSMTLWRGKGVVASWCEASSHSNKSQSPSKLDRSSFNVMLKGVCMRPARVIIVRHYNI